MHRHAKAGPMLVLPVVAVLASLVVAGCARSPSGFSPSVIEPTIVPASGQRGSQSAERAFSFEGGRVTLRVPVDRAVYAGSESASKSAVFLGAAPPSDWVPAYYRAFIDEQHQEAFYTAMLDALHAVRRRDGLDSARYVELVTSMAQGLDYRVDPVNLAPKFPIETFGDGYGDCDDKTLLAAALLSRDGYDVAILLFEPEKHVALGIRAPGLDYKGTGYAYVELTEPSLVGVPAEKLAGGVSLASQPEVIRIGSGTEAFTGGTQIAYIQRRLEEVRAAEVRMHGQITREQADLTAQQATLAVQRKAAQGLTDPHAQAAAIQRYNQAVQASNDRVARLNRAIRGYNTLLDAERYVAGHQFARPQVYGRLRSVTIP